MKIIAIEGIDGAGKTTVMGHLRTSPALKACTFTGEFSSAIGHSLQNNRSWLSNPLTKLYLFAADRALILHDLCSKDDEPGLVIWDRYVYSAMVYREAELRLGRSTYGMKEAAMLNSLFPPPDHVILLDIPVAVALVRRAGDKQLLTTAATCYDEILSTRAVPFTRVDASRNELDVANHVERIVLDALQ